MRYKKLESGIILPYSETQKEEDNYQLRLKLEREYNKKHQKCPNCGSNSICTTCIGYMLDINHPEKHKNNNKADCGKCGWEGIVDDLQ